MQPQPELSFESIITCLYNGYGVTIKLVEFLPSDVESEDFTYRVIAANGTPYDLKLRRTFFDEKTTAIPALLAANGAICASAPVLTSARLLWLHTHGHYWMLLPVHSGKTGFDALQSRTQWTQLGQSMKAIHTCKLTSKLEKLVPQETFSSRGRKKVSLLDELFQVNTVQEPVSAKLIALWQTKREDIQLILARAEKLSRGLGKRIPGKVICHGNFQAENIISTEKGNAAIVNWNTLVFAPKERDLMFVGGDAAKPREETWFYQGYGETEIDYSLLSYYRYEHLLDEIARLSEKILGGKGSVEEREALYDQTALLFDKNRAVEVAHRTFERIG